MSQNNNILPNLTDTSYSTILKISIPTILSSLSSNIMEVIDQVILARYSLNAMAGAASAATWCTTFRCAAISLVFIAGAFVGNYNGAKKYKFAGMPVWQMIWFSLFLFALSIPISMFCGTYVIPHNLQSEGLPYFHLLMACVPIFTMRSAINAFFIAIGRGFLVTISVFIAIIFNTVIDLLLVHGTCGITAFMGAKGAAIGTIVGGLSELTFALAFFLRKDTRKKYGTLNCKLRPRYLAKYMKLGAFASVGHICESLVYSIIYYYLASVSTEYAVIQTICVTTYMFLLTGVMGIEKGVMSITANLLGAKLRTKIDELLKRGVVLHLAIAMIFSFIVILFPNIIIGNFININTAEPDFVKRIINVLYIVLLCYLVDGVVWVEAGVLEGGGDLNFQMVALATSSWVCIALPVFFMYHAGILTESKSWILGFCAGTLNAIVLFKRYRSDKWIHITV